MAKLNSTKAIAGMEQSPSLGNCYPEQSGLRTARKASDFPEWDTEHMTSIRHKTSGGKGSLSSACKIAGE
jgi:hypothetical protein